jgi:hypothetical protein
MFVSHRSTRLVAGLLVSAAALFGTLAPHAHAASAGEKVRENSSPTVSGMKTATDPTGVYQISYPKGWSMSTDKGNLVLSSKDGNVVLVGMDWTGSKTNSPLATSLPTMPGLLKLGTASGKPKFAKTKFNGTAVQYGILGFTTAKGGDGTLVVVRGYDQGHVVYLIGVIEDSSASTANNDINQLVKVVYTTRFL